LKIFRENKVKAYNFHKQVIKYIDILRSIRWWWWCRWWTI